MNMTVRLPEPPPLSQFRRAQSWRAQPTPAQKRSRTLSACAVLAAHVGIVALILWGGATAYHIVVPPKPITVELKAEAPKPEVTPPPPQPDFRPPDMPVVIAPEIQIQTQATITVQQVKRPPAPPPPPPAGTTRDTYFGKIIAHLDAAKRYPPEAKRFHIQGVVMLHFVMDRQGRVLSFDIARSSGRPMLDDEVRALIARAQPLPPIPADWPQAQLDLVVPVEFNLH